MQFEGLAGAINVSIVAFSIVFGVLLVLTGTIFAMKLFAGSGAEKKNEVTPAPAKPAAKPAAPVAQISPVAQVSQIDNKKLVAAITAAIVKFSGSNNFRILSVTPEAQGFAAASATFRPVSRWKTAGMLALNNNGLVRKWK